MSTTMVYATLDGYLNAVSPSYPTAKSGAGAAVVDTQPLLLTGQIFQGGLYTVYQSFIYWPYAAIPATDRLVGAAIVVVRCAYTTGTSVPRTLGYHFYDWTPGGLTAADWRNVYDDPAAARILNSQAITAGQYAFMSSERLRASVATTTSQSLAAVTERQRNLQTPTGGEETNVYSLDESGTISDPVLLISTLPRCTLSGSLAAQVRLTSGGWAGIEMVSGTTPRLVFISAAGAATTIGNLPVGTSSTDYAVTPALQSFALIKDDSDNLYIAGKAGDQDNQLQIACWTKGSGSTWTAPLTWRRVGLPAAGEGAVVNQVSGAWVNVRGGTLFMLAGHGPGEATSDTVADLAQVQVSSDWVRGLSSTSSAVTADTTGTLAPPVNSAGDRFNAWTNETGTVLDVVRPASALLSVYTFTTGRNSSLSENYESWMGRAVIGTTPGVDTLAYRSTDAWAVKDAGARGRILPINSTTIAVVTADSDTGYGITIRVWQTNSPGAWTYLGGTWLGAQSIASMPTPATLGRAPTWDAVYNSAANTIYVYYVDVANARTVRRTGFSLNSYLPDLTEVTTVSNVGGVGTTIQALRADAHDPSSVNALLTIAHNLSGAYSTTYTVDSFNLAPNAPILTPKANYDATTAGTFAWTFSDPNAGDTQSAYDLQIVNTATSALVVNTGWTTSTTSSRNVTAGTLTNGNSYQWRVRTRDAAGLDGTWSAYGSFSTATGGTVTITSPATDNPAGVITDDYAIVWSVSGTTQDSYRVILTRTGTGAVVSDTGWVAGTATTANVSGMLSGVEHTVSVQVRNAALVVSGIGTRKITPVYDSPEIPVVTLTPTPAEGYVLVSINNPIPQGDRPEATTNLVLRRVVGETSWLQVGTAAPDGTFRDYSAGARRTYEYKVRAVS